MQKTLKILGVLTLIFICIVGISIGVVAYKGDELDDQSKAYVDAAIPAIAGKWDQEQLVIRSTPSLRESITPDQLSTLFWRLSLLGPLVRYEGSSGQSAMSYFNGVSRVTALYVAKAQFKNGNATFHIALLKLNGQWLINGFRVDPKVDTGSQN